MTISFLLLLAGTIRLGSAVGVSQTEASQIVDLVHEAARELQADDLDVRLEVIAGATKHLVTLEHRVASSVVERIECQVPAFDIARGRRCIAAALRQFATPLRVEAQAQKETDLVPPVPLVVDEAPDGHPAVWWMVALLGVATVTTGILAWQSMAAGSSLDDHLYIDADFLSLERRRRDFETGAVVSLSVSVAALVGLVAVTMIDDESEPAPPTF